MMVDSGAPLLAPDEPPALTVTNPRGAGSAVVVCDHASNRVPRHLDGLGLGAAALASHIAWDPGAADVAQCLARHLDAPLVAAGYSRLVIDCNRPLASDESIAPTSAGVAVPGNRAIGADDRARRIAALFHPYHRAIADVLDRRAAAGRPSLLLSVHSFTPALNGHHRPWQVAFAYGRDPRLAKRFIDAFADGGGFVVGHNQPYSVDDTTDHTIPVHGEQRGLPHVLIEIRQDLLTTPADCAGWAARLAAAYRRSESPLVA
jgi:predicted N-formylglutamate amidohydrolase